MKDFKLIRFKLLVLYKNLAENFENLHVQEDGNGKTGEE